MRLSPLLFTAAVLGLGLSFATPAQAEMTIQFYESAPRDRLIVQTSKNCKLGEFILTIDLAGSAGRLIFDTVPGGPGVNVAQPFQIANGAQFVESVSRLNDGDEAVAVQFSSMAADSFVTFTVDLDDREPSGPMGTQMIGNSELVGAFATVVVPGKAGQGGSFDQSGSARIPLLECQVMS